MRQPSALPKMLVGIVAVATTAGLLTVHAATAQERPAGDIHRTAPRESLLPGPDAAGTDHVDRQSKPLTPAQIGPRQPTAPTAPTAKGNNATAASCTPADFGSRTGDELVTFVKASTTDCINSVLFGVTGSDAHDIFQESQMVTVADAFSNESASYPGDNSTSVQQLVLFLRAGYYVQFNHPDDVGEYGDTLATAIESGLDKFVASSHLMDVNDGNGAIVAEVMTLTDSADEQHRYLSTYKRMLDGYDSSYDQYYYMITAVNNVYTPLWRGHQNPEFVAAVTADPSIVDTLNSFAHKHLNLLGTENAFLDSNAGRELTRFVQHAELQAKVRPLAKGLLKVSEMTGKTAPLWVGVAEMANEFDKANCADYDVCDLPQKLKAASLPITHKCDVNHTFRVQSMTADELAAACTSVRNQDAYFHNLVTDSGPVADDHNESLELDVWASKTDYATYSSVIFGNDTNNGGMYLEGDPADPDNQARFVAYQRDDDDSFPARIWNLNHEYTHYLDGRYDMHGDFAAGNAVPDIWWVEGLAEYVSYSYRKLDYAAAIEEAGKHTYDLSTLWQTTYENSDVTRTYNWGYLAVRYMVEKHPDDLQTMLAKFRTGDYEGGYDYYNTTIGNRYDADFDTWLTACNTGACSGGSSGSACSGTNGTDVAIRDKATVSSRITLSGCTGNASAKSTVEAHIVHSYSGDLVVSLVAPDGTVYKLRKRIGGSTANVDQTFTADLSGEARNGTWKLRVRDAANKHTGYIDTWTLTL